MTDFQKRLNELVRDSGKTQKDFAKDVVDVSRQSLSNYLNGERTPDCETLRQICEKCQVSADWILGLSDVRSTDTNFQSACKTFGLTDEQGIALQDHSSTFAYLLEIMSGYYLLRFSNAIDSFGFCTQLIGDTDNNAVTPNPDGTISMPAKQAAIFYADMAGQILSLSLKKQISEEESKDGQS